MNKKSNTEKTAFGLSEEDFYKKVQERSKNSSFEDPALKQFVKETSKSAKRHDEENNKRFK